MFSRSALWDMVAHLPGVTDESTPERIVFAAGGDKFAWTWLRRHHPRRARQPDPEVLVIACPLERKALLVEAAPDIVFDDDHYRGFPAIMVRLSAIDREHMAEWLNDAWAFQTSRPARRKTNPKT